MIAKIKDSLNLVRSNLLATKRKKTLARQMDLSKVSHLRPTVQCEHTWYGNSYGGFFIHPTLLTANSIVYSFGIGKDISFDRACIKHHQCKVYAFDPTPKSIDYIKRQTLPESFTFFSFGISDSASGVYEFYLPANPKGISGSLVQSNCVSANNAIEVSMKSFDDIVQLLGHQHIDVLKMDIEGSEYTVLEKVLAADVTIDQLLIEFHDRLFDQETYRSKAIVALMHQKGYAVFAHSSTYEEVSFIHNRLTT